jgi:protein-S-isoprenylcysteine O-methyltransferase Ste14
LISNFYLGVVCDSEVEQTVLVDLDAGLIILNVVLFFLFALIGSLEFKKKGERRLWGASVGVIVAETFGFSQRLASAVSFAVLFYISMQGIPVSIYAILWVFGADPKGWLPFNSVLLEIPGIILFFLGGLLVVVGWSKIFNAKDHLVTDGVYKYVRHPQYLGILIATLSLIIYRFSPISMMLWPVLVIIYYRLAKKEERDVEGKFGEKYREYRRNVSMLIPFVHIRRAPE